MAVLAEDAPKPVTLPATAAEAAPKKPSLPDDPAAAWKALNKATQPPQPPAEWNQKAPTPEESAAFRRTMADAAAAAADLAKEFQDRFASDAHAADAKRMQAELLQAVASLRGDSAGQALLAAPKDAFQQKIQAAVEAAKQKQAEGMPAVFAEFERQLRLLQKEYPDRPEISGGLLEAAQGIGGDRGLAIVKEVRETATKEELKKYAAQVEKQIMGEKMKLDRVGKPLDVKFKSVDGRDVDLAALKGKVVLVDFWATWCGPCVGELPHVKEAYAKLHGQGFEIVGISFDQDKDALETFIKKQAMPWPQYFDGEGWQNKFGQEFGIMAIPAMWLVDKQGNLRELEARDQLESKIEKLLAEK